MKVHLRGQRAGTSREFLTVLGSWLINRLRGKGGGRLEGGETGDFQYL